MIHLLHDLPPRHQKFGIAVSGGVDSMVALEFLCRGGRDPSVFYYHHNTPHSLQAFNFLSAYCHRKNLNFRHGRLLHRECPDGKRSQEEYWRDERYKFLDSVATEDFPIITAHHLDDCVETWLFSAIHGKPKTIPYRRNHIIRPFLLNPKEKLVEWAYKNSVPYVDDPSNDDVRYMRNQIRHNIVPEALKVNAGLHKTVKKIILNREAKKVVGGT